MDGENICVIGLKIKYVRDRERRRTFLIQLADRIRRSLSILITLSKLQY